jgi:HPt (histidine-containing phosphotransfer) domain-containing protein
LGITFESLRPMYLRFADGERKTVEKLRATIIAGNAEEARRHAHALAGAAGNLGADEFRAAAKALEIAAKEGRSNLDDLLREVEQRATIVFRAIGGLRSPVGAVTPTQGGAQAPVEPRDIRRSLERLKQALADSDLNSSTEALQDLAQLSLPEPVHREVGRLRELVDGYEYDEAKEIVQQLLAGLPQESSS